MDRSVKATILTKEHCEFNNNIVSAYENTDVSEIITVKGCKRYDSQRFIKTHAQSLSFGRENLIFSFRSKKKRHFINFFFLYSCVLHNISNNSRVITIVF